jgi:CHAD domain-containing protein
VVAYKLKRDEGMATGIRRIVDEELAAAGDDLTGGGPADRDEAVHDARKRLKKARSALRLVRDDVGADVQRSETAALRDAARRLSGARDAYVLLETLGTIREEADGALPAATVRKLRGILGRSRENEPVEDEAVAAEIAAVRGRVAAWQLEDEGFPAGGLQRIYRRGRLAMEQAIEHREDEPWHEWRKRAKDLWYALRILEPVSGKQLKGAVAEASALSDVLGEHNDVAVLRAAVVRRAPDLEHLDLVHTALDRRRDRVRLAAAPLGLRLYAEKPKAFVRRLGAYWDARRAQADADATWLEPDAATRVRELLAARPSKDAAGKRRITAEMRELGFQPPRGGLAVEDFDALVREGEIRLGSPH